MDYNSKYIVVSLNQTERKTFPAQYCVWTPDISLKSLCRLSFFMY
jgi:hypothetical protein